MPAPTAKLPPPGFVSVCSARPPTSASGMRNSTESMASVICFHRPTPPSRKRRGPRPTRRHHHRAHRRWRLWQDHARGGPLPRRRHHRKFRRRHPVGDARPEPRPDAQPDDRLCRAQRRAPRLRRRGGAYPAAPSPAAKPSSAANKGGRVYFLRLEEAANPFTPLY